MSNGTKYIPPAFPVPPPTPSPNGDWLYADGGMTQRDYFAAKAMHGMMSHWWTGFIAVFLHNRHLAEDAYKMADAMLRAREL